MEAHFGANGTRRKAQAKLVNEDTSTHSYGHNCPSCFQARRSKGADRHHKYCELFGTFQKSASDDGRA